MAWRPAPASLIALFEAVVPQDPRIVRRKMFGYPAAFASGRLFAGLHQDDFILKLSPDDRERIERDYGARPFMPMPGRILRAYRVLPQSVIADPVVLRTWVARSLEFVAESGRATQPVRRGRRSRRSR